MKSVLKRLAGVCFIAVMLAVPMAAAEDKLPSLDEGIDRLENRLMEAIATRYYDSEKRPVIKVAIFDFTDARGDITVGSGYVSDRMRLAFGFAPQFTLLPVDSFGANGRVITDETVAEDRAFRDYIVGDLKADVYVFGRIHVLGESSLTCRVSLWGTNPPFLDYSEPVPLIGEALKPEIPATLTWALTLTPSGMRYFTQIKKAGAKSRKLALSEKRLAPVIFLTQPMCDDLNMAWEVRGDGMIYDVRKKRDAGSLRNRTGQIMQSRVKNTAALKELSYVIKNFTLVVRERGSEKAYRLEPYVLPRESQYYFIPYLEGEKGLRFVYLWNKRGKSKKPSSRESGTGWSLFQAEQDWPIMMPVGNHTATATLTPIAETDYGTKRSRSEYVSRFRFAVRPGLNVYVINYVYRMDRPEIFVRRLEIEGVEERKIKRVKRITEVYQVYGGADQKPEAGHQSSGDR